MRKPVFFGLLVVLVISMFSACKHDLPVNPAGNTTPIDTGICFERDILPLFVSGCAKSGCHDANTKSEGYQLTDYAHIMKKGIVAGSPNETKLYKVLLETDPDKRMPQPPNPAFTAEQTEKIRRWIAEGAQNTTNCIVNCDSNNYLYSTAIKPMMAKYCNGCHNSQSPSGGFVLDNYEGVKLVALAGNLLGAISHEFGYSAMPQGGNKLSDCEIKQVQKWIAGGAQNN